MNTEDKIFGLLSFWAARLIVYFSASSMYERFGQNDTNLKDENATKESLAEEGPRHFYITLVGLGSHRIFVQLLSRRSSDRDFCCSRPPALGETRSRRMCSTSSHDDYEKTIFGKRGFPKFNNKYKAVSTGFFDVIGRVNTR